MNVAPVLLPVSGFIEAVNIKQINISRQSQSIFSSQSQHAETQMNQSDFRENTCRVGQAREKPCGQIRADKGWAVKRARPSKKV